MIIDIHKGHAKIVKNNLVQFFDLGLLNDKTWLAGGAIRSALTGAEISDYDMFFRSLLDAARVEVELESLGAETVFKCPEGKLTTMKYNGMKIQLITEFFYENMDHLIDTFDITACRFATDGKVVVTKYSAIRDTYNKKINLHRVDFPVATMKRVAKYAAKGYKLTSKAAAFFVELIYNRGVDGKELDTRIYID